MMGLDNLDYVLVRDKGLDTVSNGIDLRILHRQWWADGRSSWRRVTIKVMKRVLSDGCPGLAMFLFLETENSMARLL